jgi:hypothetical protein
MKALIIGFYLLLPSILSAQSQRVAGISLIYGPEATKIPVQWRKEPIKGTVEPIPVSEIYPLVKRLESCIRKYPEHILKENLSEILLVRHLIFFKHYYPGTYTHNRIWLAIADSLKNWSPEFLESVFHRELSSILLNNYPRYFNGTEWEKLLPEGVEWEQADYFTLDSAQLALEPEWLALGFLNAWAASSLENDFNAISARLFSGDKEFWHWVEEYPILRKKVLLSVQFYFSIDTRFTESYFRAIVSK